MGSRLWAIVILVLAVGCAGESVKPQEGHAEFRLPLPLESSTGGALAAPHGTAALVNLVIDGSKFYDKNVASTMAGDYLDLLPGTDPFAWAIYSVAGIGADYAPTNLAVDVTQSDSPNYIALANYSQARWEFYPVQTGSSSLPVGSYGNYVSPSSAFYFAVLADGGQPVTIEQTTVSLEDTRQLAPPTNLAALPLDGAAQLSWDLYGDSRADELRIYRSLQADMSGAVLAGTVAADATDFTAGSLANGTDYYFALTSYWTAGAQESDYSNVVQVTPQAAGQISLSGIWPRAGNREDNRGCTASVGPPNFDTFVSVEMAASATSYKNRTTPVIDTAGNVFALSADAVLHKYSADLSTEIWSFKADEHGTPLGKYMTPPQSPILDSAGNSYFVAAPDGSPGTVPYVFSVKPDGSQNWRFDALSVAADVDTPYPTLNITPDGDVVALINNKHLLVGINQEGVEDWRYDFAEAREVHASPAISAQGTIEMPVWFSGIGIDPREHWISLDAADGSFVTDYKAFGGPANIYSGLSIPGGYHVYPEQASLILLDAVSGDFIDSASMVEPLTSSPARSLSGKFVFQAHPPYGFANRGDMRCYVIDDSLPIVTIDMVFIKQLNEGSLTSQPAVDANNTIFVPDGMGLLYRIEFNAALPVDENNPVITEAKQLEASDSYYFNSFALGEKTAYIVTEQNRLYCIWDPLD